MTFWGTVAAVVVGMYFATSLAMLIKWAAQKSKESNK